MLTIAHLAPLKAKDPILYEVLTKIVTEVNSSQQAAGSAAPGRLAAPPTLGGISVTAANGFFDIALTDQVDALQAGIQYFVEFDTAANFANAHVQALGPSRNCHLGLGGNTYYFRAYSAYLGSAACSPKVVFGGSRPTGVAGGGAAGPTPQKTQGSGVSALPGYGFGNGVVKANPKQRLL